MLLIAVLSLSTSAPERDLTSRSRLKGTDMSDQTNSEYFAARAQEAREKSQSATDPRAAAAHAEMAARYEELAVEFEVERPKLRIA